MKIIRQVRVGHEVTLTVKGETCISIQGRH